MNERLRNYCATQPFSFCRIFKVSKNSTGESVIAQF